MKELKLGIVTYKELAEWFGIKRIRESQKQQKLKELKMFCDYTITNSGKIEIINIIEPIYSKQKKRIENAAKEYLKYFTKVKEDTYIGTSICVAQNLINKYGFNASPEYVARYVSGVMHKDYNRSNGDKGILRYVKCKCTTDRVKPRCYPLTEKEQADLTIILKEVFSSKEYQELITRVKEDNEEIDLKQIANEKYLELYNRSVEYFGGRYYLIMRGSELQDRSY